jgi:hypothetical protein
VRDAGVWKRGVDSDIKAVCLKLEIAQKLSVAGAETLMHRLKSSRTTQHARFLTKQSYKYLEVSLNSDGKPATKLRLIEKAMHWQ